LKFEHFIQLRAAAEVTPPQKKKSKSPHGGVLKHCKVLHEAISKLV
jgi:hypothetical protein